MPVKFWGEAVLHAAYLINRLPSSSIGWKCPYQLLLKKEVLYEDIKVFGCLCYVTNVHPKKDKFVARAIRGVFVGYSCGQKGYKVYDIENETLTVSRNVTCSEVVYPFHGRSESICDHNNSSPLPLVAADFSENQDYCPISCTPEVTNNF